MGGIAEVEAPDSQNRDESEAELLQLFKKAFSFHQQGEWDQARLIYEQILIRNPEHFDSLHLRGVIALQTNHPEMAVEWFEKALRVHDSHAPAYSNYGLALHKLKRLDDAIASFKKAMLIDPNHADAFYNCGNSLFMLKRYVEAVASYDRAIDVVPGFAMAHGNRGLALHHLNRFEEALVSHQKAFAIKPSYAEACYNHGNSLYELKRFNDAVVSYDKAIEIDPEYAEAYINRGNALQKLKQHAKALASYDHGLDIQPDCPEAYINRGYTLHCLELFEEALKSYDRAIQIRSDAAEAYVNRGFTLQLLMRTEEAIASYDQAILLRPDYAMAHSNRGIALQELKRFEAALVSLDRAIALDANLSNAHWNQSLIFLRLARFEPGWKLYEWRFQEESAGVPSRHFRQPSWLGSPDIAGKTILLHAEQGLGDTIQFCRYARMVKATGATVVLELPKELTGLLNGISGVDQLVEKGKPLPAFDFHCPLMSLPLTFKTDLNSIPDPTPYLFAGQEKRTQWLSRLGHKTQPRIGLAWRGSMNHKNDHQRSMTLSELLSHLPSGFEYVSLQKDLREEDKEALATSQIRHFGDELIDFTDTAALCDGMDVVVSVDTSVAHLAGAMGKPTWIMLPFVPDWRWLLDRDDSPWYSSVKLYRQDESRSWAPVLARVADDLQDLLH